MGRELRKSRDATHFAHRRSSRAPRRRIGAHMRWDDTPAGGGTTGRPGGGARRSTRVRWCAPGACTHHRYAPKSRSPSASITCGDATRPRASSPSGPACQMVQPDATRPSAAGQRHQPTSGPCASYTPHSPKKSIPLSRGNAHERSSVRRRARESRNVPEAELAEEHVETLTIPLAWQCVPPNRRLSCSVRRPSASDAAARASFHCRAERASSRAEAERRQLLRRRRVDWWWRRLGRSRAAAAQLIANISARRPPAWARYFAAPEP